MIGAGYAERWCIELDVVRAVGEETSIVRDTPALTGALCG